MQHVVKETSQNQSLNTVKNMLTAALAVLSQLVRQQGQPNQQRQQGAEPGLLAQTGSCY